MKKTVLFGILGLAATMATSYGQGYISLDNYSAFAGGGGNGLILNGGTGITGGFTVGLYFAVGNVVGDATSGNGLVSGNLGLGTGAGSTAPFNGAGTPGLFVAPVYFQGVASSTASLLTVEVIAYDGSTYANSLTRGHSSAFNITTAFGTGFVPSVGDVMTTFSVSPVSVPEPTTLALAGLGLASLVAFRRKHS